MSYDIFPDLLPSFTDADYPPDDHIDDTDAVNIAGTNQLLGFDFNVFDYVTDEVKVRKHMLPIGKFRNKSSVTDKHHILLLPIASFLGLYPFSKDI